MLPAVATAAWCSPDAAIEMEVYLRLVIHDSRVITWVEGNQCGTSASDPKH